MIQVSRISGGPCTPKLAPGTHQDCQVARLHPFRQTSSKVICHAFNFFTLINSKDNLRVWAIENGNRTAPGVLHAINIHNR